MFEAILQFFNLTRIGLMLNMIGTIMVACAFGRNPGGASQQENGRDIPLASFLSPFKFYTGLVIIAVGFLLQFIA